MELKLPGRGSFAASFAACSWLALGVPTAHAHLSFEQGTTHLSRYGDGAIKDGPCGRDGGTRGEHVYTYEPGETITIEVVEFIAHPGYFRIAFDNDGDDGFVDPQSIKPIDPSRACPYNQYDKCGESDFYNNETVLMDNLDPHLADGNKTYRWEVTLPDVECDNCTLQVIQVMEDVIHGAYSPKGTSNEPFYVEDVYHQCIDLVLKRGAGSGDGASGDGSSGDGAGGDGSADGASGDGASGDGANGDGASGDGANGDGANGDGASGGDGSGDGSAGAASSDGCSMAPSGPSGAACALFAFGAALLLRRRRR